ncbi:hypothetical protein ACTXT7_011184, partial [Hymenolepis weldensis]
PSSWIFGLIWASPWYSRVLERWLALLRGWEEVGYLLQIPSSQVSEELQELGLQCMFTNGDLTYYRTETTKELDKRYGDVMYAILGLFRREILPASLLSQFSAFCVLHRLFQRHYERSTINIVFETTRINLEIKAINQTACAPMLKHHWPLFNNNFCIQSHLYLQLYPSILRFLSSLQYDAETSIMHELQEEILKTSKPLLQILDYATEIDCICALATAAIKMNGVRPRIVEGNVIKIKKGRHILFETLHPNYQTNSFVSPTDKGNITLITGPNASGKTMYIKQIGLIVYLAHVGSFVPADYAAVSLVDKILAQMPADMDQQKEQEPVADASWLAMALRHTSKSSLLLLDEFPYINDRDGRKAMFLGLLEHLSQKDSPTVLITGLNMSWAQEFLKPLTHKINLRKIRVTNDAKGPIFLHEVTNGITETNYALSVAKNAGIPNEVIENALKPHKAHKESNRNGSKRIH